MPEPSIPDTGLPGAFHRLSWSNLAAQFSEQTSLAAAPLVAVFVLGAGPGATGLLQTMQTLPFLLLSIPAGVLADRASRKRLMAGAEALRALALGCVLLALLLGRLDMTLLAALGFFVATGTVVYSVAAPALVQGIVARDQLSAANRWLELSRSTAFAAGPALGGALVSWIGGSAAYVLATALSVCAALLLAGLPDAAREAPAKSKHLLGELKEGAAFVWRHPLLKPLLLTSVFFNLAWFVLQAIYVLHAVNSLGMSATEVGLSLGIYGVGMVVGALAARRIALRLAFGQQFVVGPLCAFAAAGILFLTIWLHWKALAYLAFFLFGVGPILWTISTTTLRQAVTPNAMLGRVSAVIMTATYGARPVGALIGAAVGEGLGIPACLALVLAGFALQLVIILASSAPRLSALPSSPAAQG